MAPLGTVMISTDCHIHSTSGSRQQTMKQQQLKQNLSPSLVLRQSMSVSISSEALHLRPAPELHSVMDGLQNSCLRATHKLENPHKFCSGNGRSCFVQEFIFSGPKKLTSYARREASCNSSNKSACPRVHSVPYNTHVDLVSNHHQVKGLLSADILAVWDRYFHLQTSYSCWRKMSI